jgi:uncharacterized protein (TIGR00725 family)
MALYIGVIGERICGEAHRQIAERVGRRIAENGGVLLCGGMGGVMEAASYGAMNARGLVIGILPGESRDKGNPYLTFSIITGMGEGRNLILVRSCDALIAIGGGYGTLSEIAFAHKLDIPVVGIHTWSLARNGKTDARIVQVSDPEEAVQKALELAEDRGQGSGVGKKDKRRRQETGDRRQGSGVREQGSGKRIKDKG